MGSSNGQTLSMKDISRLSGVSIATLSRYYNGQSVRPSTVQKIEAIIEQTGYRPSMAARFMKGSSSGVIGLIVPEVSHPFFSVITEGIIQEARNHRQVVLVGSSSGSRDVEHAFINRFAQSILDGLIYIPVSQAENIPAIESFRNLPLVVVARHSMFPGVPHVYHDGIKGGYLATKYLIQLGRHKVAFIASFWNPPCSAGQLREYAACNSCGCFSSVDRFRGYLHALEEAGIPYDPSLVVVTSYEHRNGVEAARELIGRFSSANGVVAMTQAVANGCASQFRAQGFSVPQDVSMVIFDALEHKSDYGYTNVELHLTQMGIHAVETLNRLMRGEQAADVCLDVSLSVRDSTTALAGAASAALESPGAPLAVPSGDSLGSSRFGEAGQL